MLSFKTQLYRNHPTGYIYIYIPPSISIATPLPPAWLLPVQILEQRLVLTHGLHAAACRVAESMGGGWTAADLETLIPSYAEEPGVKEGVPDDECVT